LVEVCRIQFEYFFLELREIQTFHVGDRVALFGAREGGISIVEHNVIIREKGYLYID
jgi:hypothetical protein